MSADNAITGGDTTVINDYEQPVAMAAAIFAGQCQRGLSGSLEEGGFSILDARQFCDLIEMANVNWQAHLRSMDCRPKDIDVPVCRADCEPGTAVWKDGMPVPACTARCTKNEASVQYNPPTCKMTPEAQHYLELYHKNLADAQDLIDDTNFTGKVDRVGSQLFKPVAILLALIWII